jgi:cell division transport system permease protein
VSLLSPRTDLALDRDASGRFLPWVIAVMVFLAMLALAGGIVLRHAAQGWQSGVEGRLTVQIADLPNQPMAPRVAAALKELQSTAGVKRAIAIDRASVELLLLPWLGRENVTADLPLPGLIDVEIAPGALDVQALGAKLAERVPGATLDDPKPWLDRLLRLITMLEILAIGVVAGIGAATIFMVIFATRAGLAAHRDAIEVLHLIGAQDGYIAGQFQRQTLALAFGGALPAGLLATGTIVLLGTLAGGLDSSLLPAAPIAVTDWIVLGALPVLAVIVATVTARLTVRGYLHEML